MVVMPMNELHTRTRQVTEMVTVWIVHDSENNEHARSIAATFTDAAFEQYLKSTLRWARPGSAAWRTAQELAPSDYTRIDWRAVAAELLEHHTQPR
jgi:hypothetical protein